MTSEEFRSFSADFRPFIKGTRVRFQHHPVEGEAHREPPVSALPPAPEVPEIVEVGEFYYKPVPQSSVPHSETYFKVGTMRFLNYDIYGQKVKLIFFLISHLTSFSR